MKALRILARTLIPASLVLLAACQSMPAKNAQTSGPTTSTTSESAQATPVTPAPGSAAQETLHPTNNGARVAVFLADTTSQPGWTAVKLKSGTLYVNPKPVLTRRDLSNVRAGTSKDGVGLLALGLNAAGQSIILDVTTQNPNKRLALVVGHTMLAAPEYTVPVTAQQLVFPVGTEANATAAVRSIAGTDAGAATGSDTAAGAAGNAGTTNSNTGSTAGTPAQ